MAMDWVRWYHGTAADPKWRVVARRSGQRLTDVIAVWAMVLEAASEASERGTLEGLDPEVVAAALDLEPEAVDGIIDAMQGLVLDGDRLSAWDKRNPKREDSSAERVRRHRERRRLQQRQEAPPDAGVTPCNTGVTPRNASDTDTEIEIDTSITPSPRARARGDALDRLRTYLGQYAEAADRFATSAAHPSTWASAILGLYGPQGTDTQAWQRSPPENRPELLARALDRYAGEGKPYHARYFRRFLEAVVNEHANIGENNRRRAPENSGRETPRARAVALGAGDPSRRSGWVYE